MREKIITFNEYVNKYGTPKHIFVWDNYHYKWKKVDIKDVPGAGISVRHMNLTDSSVYLDNTENFY